MPKPNELRAAIEAYKWGMYSVAVRIQGELAYDNIAGLPEVPDDDGSTWIAKQGGTTPTVTFPDAYLNGAASFDQWLKGEDELSKGGEG